MATVGDVMNFKQGGGRLRKHWLDKYGALDTLQRFDLEHEQSLVRELEMTLDHFSKAQAVVMQFFKDFGVYGLSEALAYARGYVDRGYYYESLTNAVTGRKQSFLVELKRVEDRIRGTVSKVELGLPLVEEE
jgi:hypothetical protein